MSSIVTLVDAIWRNSWGTVGLEDHRPRELEASPFFITDRFHSCRRVSDTEERICCFLCAIPFCRSYTFNLLL